jgi:hypothetical protein
MSALEKVFFFLIFRILTGPTTVFPSASLLAFPSASLLALPYCWPWSERVEVR